MRGVESNHTEANQAGQALMIDPKLNGKVAVVTGANHGIGAATARALAAQGVSVLVAYLRLPPEHFGVAQREASAASSPGAALAAALRDRDASEVVRDIREAGGTAHAHEADLRSPNGVAKVFDRAEEEFGPVDMLVNNAQDSAFPEPLAQATAETIDRAFSLNTRGTVLMIAEFVRRARGGGANWGRVVNVSTDAAQRFGGHISYGASKAAVEAYTRSIAGEVGPLGITVNAVAPGPVQTGSISAAAERAEANQIPLGRIGTTEDIADVIVFLASEQARWLTGAVLRVCGGHIM